MSLMSKNRWKALAFLALAQFLVVLDASIVNIALPQIGKALQMDLTGLSWLITSYVLAFGGLLLLGGRLSDRWGHRRVFLFGVGGFVFASLVAGLASSTAVMIGARVFQGLSAALLAPAALALVSILFPGPKDRAKALGIWGAVAGLGSVAGVLLGGVLTSSLGWPWVFFVNIPVGVLVLSAVPRLVAKDVPPNKGPLDLWGALLITVAMTSLVAGLSLGGESGWASTPSLAAWAGFVVFFILFVIRESLTKHPLIPLGLFRTVSLTAGASSMLLLGGAMTGLFFALSLFMQNVLGYSPLTSGLTQLPLAGTLIVVAGLVPMLLNRFGPRTVGAVGLLVLAGGLVGLSWMPSDADFVRDLLGPMLVMGTGLGLAFIALTQLTVADVRAEDSGLAGGVFNASQQLGGAFGLALVAAVVSYQSSSLTKGGASALVAMASGFELAFQVTAALSVAAAIVVLVVVRFRGFPAS